MANRDEDRKLLKSLAAHGSDLTKPAHIIHFLYFNSPDAARAAASELAALGYQNIRARPAPGTSWWRRLLGPRQYSCVAEIRAVPSESDVFETTDQMESLAARLGGEYDGWEASVEK